MAEENKDMIKSSEMRKHLIDTIATESRFAKKDVAIILSTYHKVLRDVCKEMPSGSSFTIMGFAKFSAMDRKERMALNPKTGDKYPVPAAKNIKVKVTGWFHNFVNGIYEDTEEEEEYV